MNVFCGLLPIACSLAAFRMGLADIRAADFQPDPATVQRFETGFRYPQSGWTVIHIEGDPYQRGIQHGRLLAPEIAGFIRAIASSAKSDAAEETWRLTRSFVNAMFLRRFSEEQLQEMQGIADGAAAAGAQFAGHPLDLVDIVAINTTTEMESIDVAMSATPDGLEEFRSAELAKPQLRPIRRQGEHCCAFAANGVATSDGKIVFGHITTDDLRPACYFNIWMDLKPTSGHRFVMQTVPGGIYSSIDYSISETGIVMGETNVSQTAFIPGGTPLASRARQAVQYAESIDQTVAIMTENGNGLGSAEWVLADLKRNEIALLVMGTRQHKLFRSSEKQWIAGAEGFYWSCNNAKDQAVRLESVASMKGDPTAVASDLTTSRDSILLQLYDKNKGRIDADFARMAAGIPALATAHSVDALCTTTDLGLQLRSLGCFGPPTGIVRLPTFSERQRFPEIRPLIKNPWAVLNGIDPPAVPTSEVAPAADLHDPVNGGYPASPARSTEPPLPPLWHGTLLPDADSDIWLTNGFAFYRGPATREKYLSSVAQTSGIDRRGMDDLATELFYYRSVYEQGARNGGETPLSKIRSSYRELSWNQVALGKGVLLLHALKGLVGAEKFAELMEAYGQANGGKPVTSRQFQEFIEKGTSRSWSAFFDAWLNRTGLPMLELGKVEVRREGDHWYTNATVRRNESGAPLAVNVTVETDTGETSVTARLEEPQDKVELITDLPPRRVIVDKYRISCCGNGVPFTALTYDNDLENTLIIYGSLDEAEANREGAMMLQQGLCKREHGVIVPVKADTETTEDDLRNHHLVLLGHPGTNAIASRFRKNISVSFGPHSFSVRGVTYANPESTILVAAENPLNRRFLMVFYAGLGTRATIDIARKLDEENLSYAPVILLPAGQKEHNMVLLSDDLIREIPPEMTKD